MHENPADSAEGHQHDSTTEQGGSESHSMAPFRLPLATVLPLLTVSKSSDAIGAALNSVQRQTTGFLPLLQRVNEVGAALEKTFAALQEPWRRMTEQMGTVARALKAYPDNMREGLAAMSQSGWYLDLEMGMSEPWRFKQAVDSGREADAEAEMVKHFEARSPGIHAELVQAYPHRKELFDAAFDAHLRGQHLVSIPVLLAQVDGICFDLANAHFFMGRERPKVVAHAAQFAGSQIARAFLAPLESEMTITLSEKARPPGFTGLNRHMVIHGESVDYGTKENGLRAISLLNYISQSLQRELRETDALMAEAERPPQQSPG